VVDSIYRGGIDKKSHNSQPPETPPETTDSNHQQLTATKLQIQKRNKEKKKPANTRLLYKLSFLPSKILAFTLSALCSGRGVSGSAVPADFHVQPGFLSDCFLDWVQYWHLVTFSFGLRLRWFSVKYTFCLKILGDKAVLLVSCFCQQFGYRSRSLGCFHAGAFKSFSSYLIISIVT
jgi:hypothetical protein